jgi:hypothetical protein
MNKSIKNYGDVITLKCSTAATLATKAGCFVYESAIGEVSLSGTAQNAIGVNNNVYVLLNTPAIGEEAQCGVLGSGQFRVKCAAATAIGVTVQSDANGLAKATTSTATRVLGILDEAATAAKDLIICNTELNV